MKLKTPILFIVFNRLETTNEVLKEIAKAKPKKLYLASDGPRADIRGEEGVVNEIRDFIIKNINWECEVYTLFREKNLGCKYAVSSAIDWFFSNEKEGIILEDDCLPGQSFFKFCELHLEKYRDDKRIWHVAGGNFNEGWIRNPNDSYYFGGIYGSIWGWATWADRWSHFDVEMTSYDDVISGALTHQDFYNGSPAVRDRLNVLKKSYYGYDTWDFQWVWVRWINSGLTINPSQNLVKNIGFGEGATHTKRQDRKAFLNVGEIDFPLRHPKQVLRDAITEDYFYTKFVKQNIFRKMIGYIKERVNA